MEAGAAGADFRTDRKPAVPISEGLRTYLAREGREVPLPVTYAQLRRFSQAVPLLERDGTDTLWETVAYPQDAMQGLSEGLLRTYALLRGEGSMRVFRHVFVDRIDYCAFGNSQPFRIRIVNAYNENHDYFYVKVGDASRIAGLELEHLLSPNRMHYLTEGDTLVEEHVVGIPGDRFATHWLGGTSHHPVRLAKELIKFEERCLVRLLGDMRAYNFVIAVTPDFDATAIRVRAMDFDQQSHNGRLAFYLPGSFKENRPFVDLCARHINAATAAQYRREEQSLIHRRHLAAPDRLRDLLEALRGHPLSTTGRVSELAKGLADHHRDGVFLGARDMPDLVGISLERLGRVLRT
jgi:hypothetical protein